MTPRTNAWIVALLIFIASVRIAATYRTFSPTFDEPAHIACGMEWLERGTYTYEDQHPPLARVAAALLPWLNGNRGHSHPNMWEEGWLIVADDPANLILARAGILPFFWIACVSLFYLAREIVDSVVATWSVAFFTLLPPILAHAGLATTDMALTAGVCSALLFFLLWLRAPTFRRAALLGVSLGFALLCKFSSLPFIPAAAFAMSLTVLLANPARLRRVRVAHLLQLALALAIACLLVWAGYGFSWGQVRGDGPFRPAPEFWAGLKSVRAHNRAGNVSYLLGQTSQHGFFWFYPVCIAVKTPLAWLFFAATGAVAGWNDRRMWMAFGPSLAILAVAMGFGHINLGIRHILPVYLGFSVVAAMGLKFMIRRRAGIGVAACLALWLLASTTHAHPDYLAYFNELAGNRPEHILIDSDLDWGQDVFRLEKRLADAHAASVAVLTFGSSPPSLQKGGIALSAFSIDAPKPGWNAVGITPLTILQNQARTRDPNRTFWFERMPPEHVGKGILLWYYRTPG